MEHLTRWERLAVVTDVEWIKHAVRFFSFLLRGTTKFFCSLTPRGGTRMDHRRELNANQSSATGIRARVGLHAFVKRQGSARVISIVQ